jgi:formamidopyrimidine-DNA glycosylase
MNGDRFMSVELPEVQILCKQMNRELQGKQIVSYQLRDYQKLQKIGFINRDVSAFDRLSGGSIEHAASRGNVMLVKLDNGVNLVLAPEYGGRVLYSTKEGIVPAKFHLKLCFSDDTALTVTLTGMGVIQALKDNELGSSYVYKRDFLSTVPSPIDEGEFTFEQFSNSLTDKTVNIKSALVGKDAVLVGLSNSAFQDILCRARIHPKRKASSLTESEKRALYEAIKFVVQKRIQLGGKSQFVDLYGKQGSYTPVMGPNMKGQVCPTCGTKVENLSLGGGQTYYCPKCQI